MRQIVILSLLAVAGLSLGGCSASSKPEGVLPRMDLPPPPSVGGSAPARAAVRAPAGAQPQRRGLSVPDRLVPPTPSAQP
ncbi:hypothetical protein [Microvirga sp. TS319]|uniref:hypothetical protein n=1 Tax=Microvirga sp. TS319 TaxID=3241165 RepID=UPI003519FAEB